MSGEKYELQEWFIHGLQQLMKEAEKIQKEKLQKKSEAQQSEQ